MKVLRQAKDRIKHVPYALILDSLRDASVWLSIRSSNEEKAYVRQAQVALNELAAILEGRRAADQGTDEAEWNKTATELLSLLRKAVEVRGCMVGTSLPRLIQLLDPAVQVRPTTSSVEVPSPSGPDRRTMVDDYIKEVREKTGKKITRTDIWKAAGYTTRTEFERWQRRDENRKNTAADESFMRILRQKPHLR